MQAGDRTIELPRSPLARFRGAESALTDLAIVDDQAHHD
jgi:hypothetical protein